ncbi:uncharacterized protein B0I36DRAFT_352897 [Microdochium trichocladiopsis]|uniref:Uncharacterized protein n=1 Tax=Microdochium trichocladiopsis TaxID=1682393 RepID=A0A9P9BLA2_9PEZI|nr:uncharacterized protein B0I36DRAFT_352897 [Microdochium trichocladiopsis]KAH7024684.1 hypothetical protein B0I36DRAFT_352897 [Microdochium trichocladiopsis]
MLWRNQSGCGMLAAWIAALWLTILLPASHAAPDYANINPDPDAWGVVPVPGFRLDRQYPGLSNETNSTDGTTRWELDLRINRNAPKTSSGAGAGTTNVTRVTVQLRPPAPGQPGAVLDNQTGNWSIDDPRATDSWKLIIVSFAMGSLDQLKAVEDGNDKQRGSCPTSVMSEQCARDIRESMATNSGIKAGNGFLACPNRRMLNRLTGILYKTNRLPSAVSMNDRFNETTTYFNEITREELENAYDVWGSVTHPFALVWAHSNTTAQGEALDDDHVVLACVKVDSTAPGVPMPQAVAQQPGAGEPAAGEPAAGEPGAGATLKGSSGWRMLGGMVLAGLITKEIVF